MLVNEFRADVSAVHDKYARHLHGISARNSHEVAVMNAGLQTPPEKIGTQQLPHGHSSQSERFIKRTVRIGKSRQIIEAIQFEDQLSLPIAGHVNERNLQPRLLKELASIANIPEHLTAKYAAEMAKECDQRWLARRHFKQGMTLRIAYMRHEKLHRSRQNFRKP